MGRGENNKQENDERQLQHNVNAVLPYLLDRHGTFCSRRTVERVGMMEAERTYSTSSSFGLEFHANTSPPALLSEKLPPAHLPVAEGLCVTHVNGSELPYGFTGEQLLVLVKQLKSLPEG